MFPIRSDIKGAVQSQKMYRGLKYRIKEVEGLHYLRSKNKGTDQLCNYTQLICVFVFTYTKSRFSHDAAYMFGNTIVPCYAANNSVMPKII